MSSYQVIREASRALRDVIWQAIDADNQTRPIVLRAENIVFANPTETAQRQDKRLSVWLYQVTENEFLKNQPPVRIGDNGQLHTPLALNLYYLVTPFARDDEADQLVLGRVLQAMHDNTVVVLKLNASNVYEELRFTLCRLTLEELTRIWEALREPYRLSVCYQVRVTHIESLKPGGAARVMERAADFLDTEAPALTGA